MTDTTVITSKPSVQFNLGDVLSVFGDIITGKAGNIQNIADVQNAEVVAIDIAVDATGNLVQGLLEKAFPGATAIDQPLFDKIKLYIETGVETALKIHANPPA